jgi:hypothetical protein
MTCGWPHSGQNLEVGLVSGMPQLEQVMRLHRRDPGSAWGPGRRDDAGCLRRWTVERGPVQGQASRVKAQTAATFASGFRQCARCTDCDVGGFAEDIRLSLALACYVRCGVTRGVKPDLSGDEVGDGLDLRLASADAGGGVVGEAVLVVGADVANLVGECLDGLGGLDVVADADGSGVVRGVPIDARRAGSAFEPVPVLGDELGEVVPEPVGCVAREERGPGVRRPEPGRRRSGSKTCTTLNQRSSRRATGPSSSDGAGPVGQRSADCAGASLLAW